MYSTEKFTQLVINAVIKDKGFRPELEEEAAERMLEGINNNTRALWALEDAARMVSEIYEEVDDEVCEAYYARLEEARTKAEDMAKQLDVRTTERERKDFIKKRTMELMELESAETKLDQMLEWAKKNGGSYDIFSDGDMVDISPVTPREVKWLKDFEDSVREDLAKGEAANTGYINWYFPSSSLTEEEIARATNGYRMETFEVQVGLDPDDKWLEYPGDKSVTKPYTRYHETKEEFEACDHCEDNDRP